MPTTGVCMFGYVVANIDKLTSEQKQRYQSCYCGLCRALGSRHGTISRITLTYDMTFLVLLLSSLYQNETQTKTARCLTHPFKPRQYWQNEMTDYAADMNALLAYYNFLDDWNDDKKLLSLYEAKLLEKAQQKVSARYPNQSAAISACLKALSEIEKSGEPNPDIPANCFGKLMGEVFVLKDDDFAIGLRAFGNALGKFIYIMDACLDLKSDLKNERYNPLIASSSDHFSDILNLLMADCLEKYRQLPVHHDKELIENILYSGVWTRYEAEKKKTKETPHQ